MTSADKLGMIVAVAVVVIFVGLGVGMSNVSEDNARPDIDQQRAGDPNNPNPNNPNPNNPNPNNPNPNNPNNPNDPKYSIKPGMQEQEIDKNIDKSVKLIPKDFPVLKDKPIKESEYCWVIGPFGEKVKDGIDNDGDGWIDEPDPLGYMPLGPHPGVDWDYCDLSMVDRLDGRVPTTADEIKLFDFTDMDLSEATIRHATAKGTIFTNTNLENAQFGHLPSDYTLVHPYTDATGAIFSYSEGDNVEFSHVTLNDANFDNSKMMFAVFDFAGMEVVSMRDANMPESSLIRATVIHSDLQNANFKYSDMTRVNLESTDLSNAILFQVTFDEGLLVDAYFTNAYMDESTLRNVDGSAGGGIDRISKYDDASMKEVIICNSNFDDATFEDADLTNSVFNDCEPGDEISFRGTNLHNAEFMGVFIPADPGPTFPSMIDGVSPISGVSTDKSCLHHPYCDLEPIPGDTSVPDTSVPDTSVPDTSVPDTSVPADSIFTEIDGEYFYDVDGELLPVAEGELVQVIMFTEGSGSPGCESTEDGCYLPSTLVKEIGLSVIWANNDTSPHTVTSGSPAEGPDGYFDSGLMMVDDSFEFPFEEEGTFDYFCMVHPWMTGTVIIVPETPDD
ncbi:pentapeptide repeat-containing protein [Nitrosopumilus sp.]|nr:pentapeptide repeat-containing protein [Nitrosopumilus sp.]